MAKDNITLPLSSMTATETVTLARLVAMRMKDNPNFATPLVPLKTLTDQATALESAIEVALHGSRQDRFTRDNLVGPLKDALAKQADYVRSVCEYDRAKLASSGFTLRKQPEPNRVPNTPLIKVARMTNVEGQVDLRWTRQQGASMYQVWMTESNPLDGEVQWTPVGATTRVSQKVDNLTSYKAYWFCVNAVGAAGESLKSDPAIGRAA